MIELKNLAKQAGRQVVSIAVGAAAGFLVLAGLVPLVLRLSRLIPAGKGTVWLILGAVVSFGGMILAFALSAAIGMSLKEFLSAKQGRGSRTKQSRETSS